MDDFSLPLSFPRHRNVADDHRNKLVALKIQKSASQYTDAALDEIDILNQIAETPCDGDKYLVTLLDNFPVYGPNGKHICLVFETMGENLLALIKKHDYRGMPLWMVKLITKQILIGLDFLHTKCKIIHTDVKPENFLLGLPQMYKLEEVYAERARLQAKRRQQEAARIKSRMERLVREAGNKKLNKNQKKRLKLKLKKHQQRLAEAEIALKKEQEAEAKKKTEGEGEGGKTDAAAEAAGSNQETGATAGSTDTDSTHNTSDQPNDSTSQSSTSTSTNTSTKEKSDSPSSSTKANNDNMSSSTASTVSASTSTSTSTSTDTTTDTSSKDNDGKDDTATSTDKEQKETSARTEKDGDKAIAADTTDGTTTTTPEPSSTSPSSAASPATRKRTKSTARTLKMKDELNRIAKKNGLVTRIADLGNGCWTHKHFTDDVTTRQYRSPEVIVGAPYGTAIDVWSVACLVFELVTGDYLFDPKEDKSGRHSRNEDHLALMMELLGKMPKRLISEGKYSKQIFNRKGQLRNIHDLDSWGLNDVLREKYKLNNKDAFLLSSFLTPMLSLAPEYRVTAAQALRHSWLEHLDPSPEELAAYGIRRERRSGKSSKNKSSTESKTAAAATVASSSSSSSSSSSASAKKAANGTGTATASFTVETDIKSEPLEKLPSGPDDNNGDNEKNDSDVDDSDAPKKTQKRPSIVSALKIDDIPRQSNGDREAPPTPMQRHAFAVQSVETVAAAAQDANNNRPSTATLRSTTLHRVSSTPLPELLEEAKAKGIKMLPTQVETARSQGDSQSDDATFEFATSTPPSSSTSSTSTTTGAKTDE